jgi:hypothetical protein
MMHLTVVPSGTSLLYTSNRIKNLLNTSHQDFPPIPETLDALAATGVTSRPTFFGCDPKESPPEYPLIVYLPNTPPVNGGDPVTEFVPAFAAIFSFCSLYWTQYEHIQAAIHGQTDCRLLAASASQRRIRLCTKRARRRSRMGKVSSVCDCGSGAFEVTAGA